MASDDVGLSPVPFYDNPEYKRHPNYTKTDQLPISEVITGLPRPYHNTALIVPFHWMLLYLLITLKILTRVQAPSSRRRCGSVTPPPPIIFVPPALSKVWELTRYLLYTDRIESVALAAEHDLFIDLNFIRIGLMLLFVFGIRQYAAWDELQRWSLINIPRKKKRLRIFCFLWTYCAVPVKYNSQGTII